jgi:hypothetical protein
MDDPIFEKLGGLFDRRYWLACWFPACIGLSLFVVLLASTGDLMAVGDWWHQRTSGEQFGVVVAYLFVITFWAYFLQAITIQLLRLYEGYYWPDWPVTRAVRPPI